jgi:hypothetical protein
VTYNGFHAFYSKKALDAVHHESRFSKESDSVRWGALMRLPVLATAAILGLGLICSSASARQLWLPTTDNPFCAITTYLMPELPEQAMSTIDADGQPVIVVSAMTIAESAPYGRFLMAHECSHHTLGHVAAYHRELGHLGPQPFFYIAPQLKHMELDADCNAVKMLKLKNEPQTIEVARQMMLKFGDKPTGAYYPTGIERADNIAKCAAED